MSSNSDSGKGEGNSEGQTRKEHEGPGGLPGKQAHGGDVAPPNSDDAGTRQSPESGPPDRA